MSQSNDENSTTAERRRASLKIEQDAKRARVASKLKENLLRRKQQMRARRAGDADEAEGLPAAKSSQADD
ncbi:hypothetical protein ACQQ2Q_13835 [Agrobacterium sp. ES01]|uniref:hypothetical protein n=1 Tax=Agrobacterium sp. ES01 TaxID=3420714 RepID=UPI003D0A0D8D